MDAADEGRLAPAKVARLLTPLLADPDLGKHVVATVVDLSTGDQVFTPAGWRDRRRPPSCSRRRPPSTCSAPTHRFATRVVLEGQGKRRRLVLVGGGDPYLASKPPAADEPGYPARANLRTLARATARALRQHGVRRARLAYDDSLFTGPDASPQWEKGYLPDGVVAPIRALWADEGTADAARRRRARRRLADPARPRRYFSSCRAAGVLDHGPAPSTGSPVPTPIAVAEVDSPPLWQIVERMLTVSDNEVGRGARPSGGADRRAVEASSPAVCRGCGRRWPSSA